jgi:hypothetical protein
VPAGNLGDPKAEVPRGNQAGRLRLPGTTFRAEDPACHARVVGAVMTRHGGRGAEGQSEETHLRREARASFARCLGPAVRVRSTCGLCEVMVCDRAIVRSVAGPCREGTIVTRADRRVVLVPERFSPLLDRIDALFTPLDDLLDR